MTTDAGDRGTSQTGRALLELRELLLKGEIGPGERLAEVALVERIGVSRTPVRSALARLAQEGFLQELPNGGYVAKSFDEKDVADAIEVRGTLEGLAVRFAAERGVSPVAMVRLKDCLAGLDAVVARADISADDFSDYMELNGRFHALLMEAAASPTLARQMEWAVALPFASPSALVKAQAVLPASRLLIAVAQEQHRCIVEAIGAREGARAESLAREHARLAVRNLKLALDSPGTRELIPGVALLKRAAG
jgi:GntR family transcriptional regulator of vanillate catabolism